MTCRSSTHCSSLDVFFYFEEFLPKYVLDFLPVSETLDAQKALKRLLFTEYKL